MGERQECAGGIVDELAAAAFAYEDGERLIGVVAGYERLREETQSLVIQLLACRRDWYRIEDRPPALQRVVDALAALEECENGELVAGPEASA